MRLSRASRTLTSWMATLAILVVVCAPVISQIMGDQGWQTLMQLCRSGGAITVASSSLGQPPGSPEAPTHVFEHCPYCALQTDMPPLVSPALALPLQPTQADEIPAAFLHAPRTLHAWAQAQPRGPPAKA